MNEIQSQKNLQKELKQLKESFADITKNVNENKKRIKNFGKIGHVANYAVGEIIDMDVESTECA